MRIPFNKTEVGEMVIAALEEDWYPLENITDLIVHKGQNQKHIMTLVMTDGSELRLTKQALEVAMVVAFNKGVAPVVVKNPKINSITFHMSDSSMAKVDVVSKDSESQFTPDKGAKK